MVNTPREQGKVRGRVQVGAPDPSLTPAGGMIAVTELCGKLGLVEALDEHMPPVKQRRRGFTSGQVLAGMAAAQLAGEDFLVGLDRLRADAAGQQVTLVPGLATSTAAGLARRFTKAQWAVLRRAWPPRPPACWRCCPPSGPASWPAGGQSPSTLTPPTWKCTAARNRGLLTTIRASGRPAARGRVGGNRDPAGRGPAGW